MEEIQSLSPATEEEVSLLDLLVTLAENARLLIIGPLLVGLCALGLGFVLPPNLPERGPCSRPSRPRPA